MNRFTKRVLQTIDKYKMIQSGQTVIAAVSGGFDSLCMLFVLCELRKLRQFNLCAAHLNHDFRKEADEDERYVKELCKKLEIQSYTKKVNVSQYAKDNKISFETAGRIIRYGFFDELMERIPNSITATAHNANDSAESFMMHLLRGSGLGGLTGISAVRGRIIRPLIEQSREQIEEYCSINNLEPRIDITNEDDSYTRNDIRHNVIPPIAKRGGIESIARTARLLSADEEFLQEYTREIADEYINVKSDNTAGNSIVINAKALCALPLAIKRRIIKLALDKCNTDISKEISLVHIESILSVAQNNYGGKYAQIPGGITASLKNGEIIIKEEVPTNDQ